MAEEVKTQGTPEGTEPQTDNTGAQEPEKKYTEEEMNGISKKNSEKAVNKFLKELGITDGVKVTKINAKLIYQNYNNYCNQTKTVPPIKRKDRQKRS